MMKVIKQSHQVLYKGDFPQLWIENAARTCYKSGAKGGDIESAKKLTHSLTKRGHMAMIEFAPDLVVKFVTNRAVTHELVRHRMCSFAQESTRYVNYGGDDIVFIEPVWWDDWTQDERNVWFKSMADVEQSYKDLLKLGNSPQIAREVLPNALKTEIVVKANLREWLHIFELRCAQAAHPQIRELMIPLAKEAMDWCPEVFMNDHD
jgi:thymidylate synthase (FAD)